MHLVPYHQLPGFDGYYLEDGWVRGVYPGSLQLAIEVDAVLTERHPDFGPPKPGEMYRYLRIAIRFPNVRRVDWIQPLNLHGNRDPDGSIDYGNIDFFNRSGDLSHLGGEWGEVSVVSDMPVVDRPDDSD